MKIGYTLPAKLNRKIGQAMHDYAMFADGDQVLVAVSGGIDSLTLACILKLWQKKMPIHLDLVAHCIDHGFWRKRAGQADPAIAIGQQLQALGIAFEVDFEWQISGESRTCFLCSKNRRSQLFNIARQKRYNKIAMGHHKDDLIETFLLNALYSGNISTMVPKQDLFGGTLSIVRPMAYLEKHEVREIAHGLGLESEKNFCPLSNTTRRERVRNLLQTIYAEEPGAKASLFAALSNIREGYLL